MNRVLENHEIYHESFQLAKAFDVSKAFANVSCNLNADKMKSQSFRMERSYSQWVTFA